MDDERVTVITGNLYEALGIPDADEMQTKSHLVLCIHRIMEERGPTQVQLAEIVGTDQPKISNILRGRFRGISVWKLTEFLNALGMDVEVVVRPKDPDRERGQITVLSPGDIEVAETEVEVEPAFAAEG